MLICKNLADFLGVFLVDSIKGSVVVTIDIKDCQTMIAVHDRNDNFTVSGRRTGDMIWKGVNIIY